MDTKKIIKELERLNYVDYFIDLVLELKFTNNNTTMCDQLQSNISIKSEIINKLISENNEK